MELSSHVFTCFFRQTLLKDTSDFLFVEPIVIDDFYQFLEVLFSSAAGNIYGLDYDARILGINGLFVFV